LKINNYSILQVTSGRLSLGAATGGMLFVNPTGVSIGGDWAPGPTLTINNRLHFYYNWTIWGENGGNFKFYYGDYPNSLTQGSTAYISTSGSFNIGSDRRLKENIKPIKYGLDEILRLTPVSFSFISIPTENGDKELGFIAQDVLEIIPQLIEYDTEFDKYYMNTTQVIPVLTKAVQELNTKIDDQSSEIVQLSSQNAAMNVEVTSLTSQVATLTTQVSNMAAEMDALIARVNLLISNTTPTDPADPAST
jgi:hypothetical protein